MAEQGQRQLPLNFLSFSFSVLLCRSPFSGAFEGACLTPRSSISPLGARPCTLSRASRCAPRLMLNLWALLSLVHTHVHFPLFPTKEHALEQTTQVRVRVPQWVSITRHACRHCFHAWIHRVASSVLLFLHAHATVLISELSASFPRFRSGINPLAVCWSVFCSWSSLHFSLELVRSPRSPPCCFLFLLRLFTHLFFGSF